MKGVAKAAPISYPKSRSQMAFKTTRIPTLNPMTSDISSKEPLIELDSEKNYGLYGNQNRSVHVRNAVIEFSPPLPSTSEHSFQNIFDRKIKACYQTCNFGYSDAESSVKMKETLLGHFLTFFKAKKQNLSSDNINKLLNLIQFHILRKIDNFDRIIFISEDNPNIMAKEWPHLQIIYSILHILLKNYVAYIPSDFASSITGGLNSPDEKERVFIKDFVINYCFQNPSSFPHILVGILKILVDYGNQLVPPFAIGSVLEIIKEFTNNRELYNSNSQIFSVIFVNYIIPLLKAPHLSFFYRQILQVIQFFMEMEQNHVNQVVDYLLKYFPYTIVIKQVYFLNFLTETIPKLSQRDFFSRIEKIFNVFSRCTQSSSSRIADAALALWSSLEVQAVIKLFEAKIFPLILPAVFNVAKNHWNQNVRQSAQKVIDLAIKTDKKLALDAQQRCVAIACTDADASRNWAKLAEMASKMDRKFSPQNITDSFNHFVRTYTETNLSPLAENENLNQNQNNHSNKKRGFGSASRNGSFLIVQPKLCSKYV